MKKSTRIASYIAIFGVVFCAGLLIGNTMPTRSLSVVNGYNPVATGGTVQEGGNLDLSTFWQVRNLLKDKYIHTESLKDQEMVWGATRGMVAALGDKFTEYMDPTETKDFNDSLNDQLEGIGAELTVRDGALVVVSTIKNSPAQKAGLLPDDIVYKIDTKETGDMTLYDAIKKIRGAKDTAVTLTLLRKAKDKPFDVKIIRDAITVASVTYEEVVKGIWHLSVNQFSDGTKIEFNKAINEIKLKNPKGIILDLRWDGGGYLNGAVDVLSAFFKGDTHVVSIEYKDKQSNEKLKTDGSAAFPDLPLVVLVNKGSASASEIVAAAIQDLKRGVIMGSVSYGKGTVQEVDPLPDGSSLRYTIAKWNAPTGRNINGIGITPDIIVEPKEEDVDKKFDRQLDEAEKYLKGVKSAK